MEKEKVEITENQINGINIEKNEDIDLLNRKDIIKHILQIIDYFSKKEQTVSFSIQGDWGSGKSWIINKIYNELYDIQDFDNCGSKYCIFTYNAWGYDYYDEPLISLFISIYKQLNNEQSIFIKNEKTRENVKLFFDSIKDCFLDEFNNIPLIGNIINFKQKFDEKKEELNDKIRKYDFHFDINQIMEATIKGLKEISNDKTLILFVDELDRCLPEYAIKVLERIHHINQNLQNIQIIYSIDRNQLSNTIKTIFGNCTPNEYLAKFIDFGINIDNGQINEYFERKFNSLIKHFDFIFTDNFSISNAFSNILPNITIRNRTKIIKKIELINSIILTENKCDISILYTEIFLSYILFNNLRLNDIEISYVEEDDDLKIKTKNDNCDPFLYQYFGYLNMCNPPITYLLTKNTPETYVKKVIYNLLKDILNNEVGRYSTKKEAKFYYDSFQILYKFIHWYKALSM